jgi:2-haloacid dehalogenase
MIFSTELFRRYKPHPDTYLGVGRLLGLEPEQVMLAAAHNYDLQAAQDLGLRTAFIPRPQEYGPLQAGISGRRVIGIWSCATS